MHGSPFSLTAGSWMLGFLYTLCLTRQEVYVVSTRPSHHLVFPPGDDIVLDSLELWEWQNFFGQICRIWSAGWTNKLFPSLGVSCELGFFIYLLGAEQQDKALWFLLAQASISVFSPRRLDYARLVKVPGLARQKPVLWGAPSEKLRALNTYINPFHSLSETGS